MWVVVLVSHKRLKLRGAASPIPALRRARSVPAFKRKSHLNEIADSTVIAPGETFDILSGETPPRCGSL